MSYTYRQSAIRRKIFYFAIIIALFVVSTFVRGLVAMPLSGKIDETIRHWNIAGQAERLEMTENTQGETELTGSAVRLLLTGSRGLMICALWDTAMDKQKKHEWNELELLVRSITKLQPHFITPWMFQSWNLAYNVSVEMDNLGDMYFYIARGIGLLAEGESINRYNPDMRYYMGFYYQNKFGVSDKVTTLRCMMELSCIPPSKREVSELQRGNQIQLQAFQKFCEDNPRLIRKMRERPINYGKQDGKDQIMFLCASPSKVIDFIDKHKTIIDVVTRYRNGKDLFEPVDYLKQFPVLPPKFSSSQEELNPSSTMLDGESDAHLVARAWYSYANEAAPPPNPEPGPTPTDYIDPERKRRVPRPPMLIIFLQGPPRAQSYVAEWLAKEGWFDKDPWDMDKSADTPWFPKTSNAQDVKLRPSATAQDAWKKAYDMWEKDGKENGLIFSEDRTLLYNERAKKFAAARGKEVESKPDDLRPSEQQNPDMVAGHAAQNALWFKRSNLTVTQFESFYYGSFVEQNDATIIARKKFFEAEQLRRKQDPKMIEAYDTAFAEWRKILDSQPRFRALESVQREGYEQNIRYLLQKREKHDPELKMKTKEIISVLAPVVLLPRPLPKDVKAQEVPLFVISQPFWFEDGPLDGVAKDGKPWVSDGVKTAARANLTPTTQVAPAAGGRPQGKGPPPVPETPAP